MKKYLLLSIVFIYQISGQLAADVEDSPCSRWYMGGIIGVYHVDSELEVGPQLGFSVGYRLSPSIRLEGELTSSVNRFKETDWDMSTGMLMANILYDINTRFRVRPYVGFGAGYQNRSMLIHLDDYSFRLEDDAFAYQGIFGLMVPVSRRAFACLEYRYVENTVGLDTNHSFGLNIKRHF